MSAKPIVLATDGSPSAAEATLEAVELARALDAQVVVVAVEHPQLLFAGTGSYGYAELWTEVRKVEQKRIEHALEQACAVAEEAGVTCEPVHASDAAPVAEQICRLAQARNAQMIVVGAHGWGSVGRVLHGSVSTAVVHEAHCPVLVVPSARLADQPRRRARRRRPRPGAGLMTIAWFVIWLDLHGDRRPRGARARSSERLDGDADPRDRARPEPLLRSRGVRSSVTSIGR